MSGTDFALALEGSSSVDGPWQYLRVVQFDAIEAMSRLFRYEIVALLKGDDCDPEEFIGKRASLRIATGTAPTFRLVHGIITEAEDVGVDSQGPLFRLTLEPPLVRARHRKRHRIFLDKTLRRIIETVLRADTGMTLVSGALLDPPMGGSAYQPASERFTWRIGASPRLDDPKARPYVVQYGESDFDFVARLLEEEASASISSTTTTRVCSSFRTKISDVHA
jgi:type VI secretion system secreted protein VgrG